jgi:flagellar basal-body rod protein FlgB
MQATRAGFGESRRMGKGGMDLSEFPIFRMMAGKMKWLSSRQAVLAQNIANADTPEYRPLDLKEVDFRKPDAASPFRIELTRTNEAHFGRMDEKQDFRTDREKNTYETLPAGNAVVLEEQLMKVAENRHQYELMTQLYRKHMQMFRIALGRNSE